MWAPLPYNFLQMVSYLLPTAKKRKKLAFFLKKIDETDDTIFGNIYSQMVFWSLNLLIGVCRNVPISKLCDDNDETIETATIEEMDN